MNFKQDTINTSPAPDYHTKSPPQLLVNMCGNLKTKTSSTAFHGRLLKTAIPTILHRRSVTFAQPKNISLGKEGRSSLNARIGRSIKFYCKTYRRAAQHAESTAPLRIVGELSHLKHNVGLP